MNPYTIVKVLGLCLGAVSVVTLSLPEQRSEINARAAGGYGFNNNPTKHSSADAEIELSVSNATTDQLDQRLEGMDHVDFSKHDPRTLGATNGVAIDVRRDTCLRIHCATGEIPAPNPHDCKKLGERLSQKDSAMFDVQPKTEFFPMNYGDCSLDLFNPSTETIVFDYPHFALVEQLLSAECEDPSGGFEFPVKSCRLENNVVLTLAHPSWFFT